MIWGTARQEGTPLAVFNINTTTFFNQSVPAYMTFFDI